MKKVLLFLYLFSLWKINAQSINQQVISSGGGSGSNLNALIDWTIGEPVINSLSNNMNQLTQGFHQTMLTVTAVQEPNDFVNAIVFPNPTSGNIQIILNKNLFDVSIQLMDLQGKVILQKNMKAQSEILKLEDLATGTYILSVIAKDNHLIKQFKINKTN
ncbi:MAG TPA: T9SS type A sorting domain-containing protein [Saprospiraceae bacterium]|nr:T9SS type A sorting domain-containing protein [Saprospiraceae bacterium]